MNILVLNGSPSGENSITLQTVRYLQMYHPEDTFEILPVGQRIRAYEKDFAPCEEAVARADLLLFCYPVYTFIVPAQLHRFIELMKEHGVDCSGKYATQITTSKHFYDVTAHRFIEDNCRDLGLHVLRGLSADMDDLLTKKGQKEARAFFRFIHWNVAVASGQHPKTTGADHSIALVADLTNDADGSLAEMIARFQKEMLWTVRLVDIGAFPFKGGCLGCFHCAVDGTCIYKDGFDEFLRTEIQTCDAIVYAYTIRDHSMGYQMKLFDDRQFCNGHRTVTMGKPVGYLVSGRLSDEPNLSMIMEARSQVGGNYLAGIVSNEADPTPQIRRLAQTLCYCVEHDYQQPQNFYGVGGLKIFRDLIFQMQGMMKADHRFYKEHGFYDFPQKRVGRILGMYLVGGLMKNKKFQGKMTEGMMLPYKKLMEEE